MDDKFKKRFLEQEKSRYNKSLLQSDTMEKLVHRGKTDTDRVAAGTTS